MKYGLGSAKKLDYDAMYQLLWNSRFNIAEEQEKPACCCCSFGRARILMTKYMIIANFHMYKFLWEMPSDKVKFFSPLLGEKKAKRKLISLESL